MSFLHISIYLSALIGVIIIAWIRSFDIYEKETYISMIWAFLAGGVTSVMVALGSYEFLRLFGIEDEVISNTLGSILVISILWAFAMGPWAIATFIELLIGYAVAKKMLNT